MAEPARPDAEVRRAVIENIGGPEGKSCPSAPCVDGALLLGVMTPSGRLAYVRPPAKIDAEFTAREQARGRPESRMRFSLPCIESRCRQWTGTSCGLVDRVIDEEQVAPTAQKLPACGIRRNCRWYSQRGADACAVCPVVVADCGGTEPTF
jgi:hypothetical protein